MGMNGDGQGSGKGVELVDVGGVIGLKTAWEGKRV